MKALVNDVAAHSELFSALEGSAQELAQVVCENQVEADSLEQKSVASDAEDPVASAARLRARFEELRGAVEKRLNAMFSLGKALTTFLNLSNRLSEALCAVDTEIRAMDSDETADQSPALRLAVTTTRSPHISRYSLQPPHNSRVSSLSRHHLSAITDSTLCASVLQKINSEIEKHAQDVEALKKAGHNLIRGSAGEELISLFANEIPRLGNSCNNIARRNRRHIQLLNETREAESPTLCLFHPLSLSLLSFIRSPIVLKQTPSSASITTDAFI